MPPVTPSATRPIGYSTGGAGLGSIFSTARVITSVCATVVFLCSPTATRGVEPASSWRARAPAVTTNSNEFGSLLRSIMGKCPDYAFSFAVHPLEAGPFRDHDAAQSVDGRGHLVVDDHEIVLGKRGHLEPRHLQPALDLGLAVLAPPAQPLLEHRHRGRHHEHRGRLEPARPHLARPL